MWQNLLISGVADANVAAATARIDALGLATATNPIRAGLVACTGNTGCKFAASDTKRHAEDIARWCETRVALDTPVNIHLTGCHHSCAQHFVSEIGLLACKVQANEDADPVEGYHIVVGGGFGPDAAIGRDLYRDVTADDGAAHRRAHPENLSRRTAPRATKPFSASCAVTRSTRSRRWSNRRPPHEHDAAAADPVLHPRIRAVHRRSSAPGSTVCSPGCSGCKRASRRFPPMKSPSCCPALCRMAAPRHRRKPMMAPPWHDPAMPMADRMKLADGKPLPRRLMAAMAQQDCGQCGYNCKDYADALFAKAEKRLNLCVPGGKDTSRMLKQLYQELDGGAAPAGQGAAAPVPAQPALASPLGRSRDNPVTATFLSRRRLNKPGSEKETWHIDIDLAGTELDYNVGNSFGIFPANDPDLVAAVIAALDAPPDFPIGGRTLREVLTDGVSLSPAPDMLFQLISYITGGDRKQKARRLAAGEDPDGDAATIDVLAALHKFPGLRPDPEAFIEALDPLQPRLYSISSSPKAHAGRVSLTVDAVRYQIDRRDSPRRLLDLTSAAASRPATRSGFTSRRRSISGCRPILQSRSS